MKKVKIEDYTYELVRNEKDGFNQEEFLLKITDYFYRFDYIFGDYAYDKLRLKGFMDKEHASKVNDISTLDTYINNFCSYGAKYFLLKKVK